MLRADAKQTDSQLVGMSSFLAPLHAAQEQWADRSVSQRLSVIKKFRHQLASNAEQVASLINLPQREFLSEHLAAEVLPVADACRFLERNAKRILTSRKASWRDRPAWGLGLKARVYREPLGVVLVIGTWNYPLFLTGTQTLQALVAGNGVLLKPGDGTSALTNYFVELLEASGLPSGLVQVLPEDPTQCQDAMSLGGSKGVNKVVFTGSAETGKKVLAQLATTATPSVMELSGSDAMFVLPGADLERVAKCIVFGLRLNGSSTCIAPRRVFVPREQMAKLKTCLSGLIPTGMSSPVHPKAGELAAELVKAAIANGAEQLTNSSDGPFHWRAGEPFPAVVLEVEQSDAQLLQKDVFAPVTSLIPVNDVEEALSLDALCPYALGATVFGPQSEATEFAKRIDAGCIVVNDLIAPTADPRVPFGGRHASGFGVTRGAEGLLEMTTIKTVVTQTSSFLPHLDEPVRELDSLLLGFLRMNHSATIGEKWKAMMGLANTGRAYLAAMKANKKTTESD